MSCTVIWAGHKDVTNIFWKWMDSNLKWLMVHILAFVLKYILNKCNLILPWEACFILIPVLNISSHLVIFKDLDLAKN